jgi:hypothetical protein
MSKDVKGIDIIVKKSYNGPMFVAVKIGIITVDGAQLSMEMKNGRPTVAGSIGTVPVGLLAKVAKIVLNLVNGNCSSAGWRSALKALDPPSKPIPGIDVVVKSQPTAKLGLDAAVIKVIATEYGSGTATVTVGASGETKVTAASYVDQSDLLTAGYFLSSIFQSGATKAAIEEALTHLV